MFFSCYSLAEEHRDLTEMLQVCCIKPKSSSPRQHRSVLEAQIAIAGYILGNPEVRRGVGLWWHTRVFDITREL